MLKHTIMKTFKELEEIGIISKYTHENYLHIITKDANVWRYIRQTKKFRLYNTLHNI
jgi:DNA-binding transcriptional regulator YhcF (GntR family)